MVASRSGPNSASGNPLRALILSFPPNAGHLRCGVSDLGLARCGGSRRWWGCAFRCWN